MGLEFPPTPVARDSRSSKPSFEMSSRAGLTYWAEAAREWRGFSRLDSADDSGWCQDQARCTRHEAEAQRSRGALADAAVAAGGARPPGALARGHRALELIDVADQVALTPVERLLELLELGTPALDSVFAELDVGFELCFALFEVGLD